MAKYIFIYKSDQAKDWTKMPEPAIRQAMQAWGEWVGSMGGHRKESGAFKFGGKSATKAGAKEADNLLTGYAIIEAANFDEALSMAQKAPNVQAGTGTIEVYEAFVVND